MDRTHSARTTERGVAGARSEPLGLGAEARIGGVRDGRLYWTRGRTVGVWTPSGGRVALGTLPTPGDGDPDVAFRLRHGRFAKGLLRPVVGSWTTTNLWPLRGGTLLATVGRRVFRSGDRGRSWAPVHRLPDSSGPMGVLPTSVCLHGGDVYLAEYTLGDDPARILRSGDDGRSFETHVETTAVRHFHGVFDDPFRDDLWATSGDADDESAVGRVDDGEFVRAGSGSQRWRAVGLAFAPTAVLWGMDCSYAERVELLRLRRDGPAEPTTVGDTDASAYYTATLPVDGELWVAVATAAEVGADSTAPDGQGNRSGDAARVLVTSSASSYETWYELAAFPRRRPLGAHLPGIPTASAYVFLAADEELGLFVNPFNARSDGGSVIRVPPEALSRVAEETPAIGARDDE
ncbi:glycosyl hydrolase [Halorubrum sp. 2020YC2]|uniref:glycosyl hydrolase n=1 Tax=Halorubrum sp. 2020YC2 TaxID=2836432 RepID=UPI001BE70F83|nr:glycosyl hydrolase [Halorubrum sp. 2020YC2]QWC20212.1 glycosyl hydrolase [Halorubrum sp. 2020YC2]